MASPTSLFGGALVALFLFGAACNDSPSQSSASQTVEYEVTLLARSDTLDRVKDVLVRSNGDLWVLSSSPPFIAVFDSTGALRRSGGRHGRGPTDYLYPFLFVEQNENGTETVGVIDLGRHQLLQVDSSLVPSQYRELRLIGGTMRADMPNLVSSLPFAVALSDQSVIASRVPRSISTEVDLGTQELVELREDSIRSIAKFTSQSAGRYRWLKSYPLWHSCAMNGLAGIDAKHQFLYRIDSSGHLDSANLPFSEHRRPVTEAAIKRNLRHHIELEYLDNGQRSTPAYIDSAVNRVFRGIDIAKSDSLPVFAAVRCSNTGTPWLQAFDLEESPVGAGRVWWRRNAVGWDKVILPKGFRPFRIIEDRLVGISTDSVGVEHLASASPRR